MHRDYQQILVTAQGLQQLRDVWIHQLTAMVNESPLLADALKVSSSMSMNARAKCERTNGHITFRATTGKSLQGLSSSLAICDELGETVHGEWLEALEQGIQKDNRACLVSISTPPPAELQAGAYAVRRLAWQKAYDEGRPDVLFLPWGLDPEDEIDPPKEDRERIYSKAYPPGFHVGMKTLKDYDERLELDRQQDTLPNFELRQCCRFTTAGGSWLPAEWVERAQCEIGLEALRGCDCWVGLDMSKSGDMTSIAALFNVKGQKVVALWHFIPDLGKRTKFNVYGPNLEGWRELPHVHVADRPLIDFDAVHGRLHWLAEHANLRIIKYDDWAGPGDERIRELLADDSLPWSEQPQVGREWSGATTQLKAWFACDEKYDPVLRVLPDPILIFSAGCARALEDTNSNIRLTKLKSQGTIDPLIAVVLSICGHAEESESRSIFDKGPISLA